MIIHVCVDVCTIMYAHLYYIIIYNYNINQLIYYYYFITIINLYIYICTSPSKSPQASQASMSPVSLPPVVAVCGGVGCLQVGVDASIHLSSPCSGGMLCYCYFYCYCYCHCYCYLMMLCYGMLCYVCMYVQTCPPEAWLLINDTNLSNI